MDGGKTGAVGFEDALKAVETVIETFNETAKDERESQKAKNAALYAALERAFVFHNTWSEVPQYATLLQQKGVSSKPRGKNASKFLPTVKALFDPELDGFAPTDQDGKDEKGRRQKTMSIYSAALELAAAERPNDVAAFIADVNGVEEARKLWVKAQKETDEGRDAAQKLIDAKEARHAAGLKALKSTMIPAVPRSEALKGTSVLAAIHFDDDGIAYLLGFPQTSDSSKALLEKFILDAAPPRQTGKGTSGGQKARTVTSAGKKTDLDRLFGLLNVGKLTNPRAIINIVNAEDSCEVRASHSSPDACMVNARIAHQDYLPLGTYWFGARATAAMRKLSTLGRFGAKFTIDGPSVMDGPRATISITATNYNAAAAAFNAEKKEAWDDLDAVPGRLASALARGDDQVTIHYETVVTKMACPNLQGKDWDFDVAVEGVFADWITTTLGVSKTTTNQRLKKAVFGTAKSKKTTFHISTIECAVLDSKGMIEPVCRFASPIGKGGISTEFVAGIGEVLAAIKAVKGFAGDGVVSVSLLGKLMRVRCEAGDNAAEVFIPSYVGEGRYAEYTDFDGMHV